MPNVGVAIGHSYQRQIRRTRKYERPLGQTWFSKSKNRGEKRHKVSRPERFTWYRGGWTQGVEPKQSNELLGFVCSIFAAAGQVLVLVRRSTACKYHEGE